MSLDILKKRIKENNISGVFLFCGAEEYTKDHYASLLRKKVDSSPLPEFNHIYFSAANDKICDLEDAVYSLPYMWDTKLIEITDLDSARITESDIEYYARIFSEIPDYITILAVLRADEKIEAERNTKTAKSGIIAFINTISDMGLVVEFQNEKSDKLITWITRHFNANNVKFDATVPREIINVCGNDMYILQSEILKLTEVYSSSPITVSDVHTYCCANSSYKYFDITSALNRRDIISAKKIWDSLDIPRDEIPMALGYIAKSYSEMLIVKTALDSGKSLDTVAKDTKIQQWRVAKIAQSLGRTDIKTLSYAINQISAADIKLKSFSGNPQKILELTFFRICTYGTKA